MKKESCLKRIKYNFYMLVAQSMNPVGGNKKRESNLVCQLMQRDKKRFQSWKEKVCLKSSHAYACMHSRLPAETGGQAIQTFQV